MNRPTLPIPSPPCSLSTLFDPLPAVSFAAFPMSANARFNMRARKRRILIFEPHTTGSPPSSRACGKTGQVSTGYIPVPPGGLPMASPPCSRSTLFAPVPAVSFAALPMSASARFRMRLRNRSTRMFRPTSDWNTQHMNLSPKGSPLRAREGRGDQHRFRRRVQCGDAVNGNRVPRSGGLTRPSEPTAQCPASRGLQCVCRSEFQLPPN